MVQIKNEHDDHVDESGSLEPLPPTTHQRDKRRSLGQKVKGDDLMVARLELVSNKTPKSGKVSNADVNVAPEMKQEIYQSKSTRKKPKIMASKVRHIMDSLLVPN